MFSVSSWFLFEKQRNNLFLSNSKSHHSLFRPFDVFISSSFQTLFSITPKFYIWFSETTSLTKPFQAEIFADFLFSLVHVRCKHLLCLFKYLLVTLLEEAYKL